jgi:hypothetical protein
MNLGTGVTVFTIGNLSSAGSSFTNTTSGGLGGTSYIQPVTDAMSGTLQDNFSLALSAFVDAGGFSNGVSDASVTVTYSYTPLATPEPGSAILVLGGLAGLVWQVRRKFLRS